MKSRRTKIICTLGPASRRKETITKMAKAGMDMVRLNFSHGTHEQHQKLIDTVREVNDHGGYKIKILQDLEGYRIRIGHIKHAIQLIKHQQIWLVKGSHEKGNHIPLESCIDLSLIKKGMEVFIADGMIALKVLERSKKKIKMEVIHGGPLGSRKGVNIPELKLKPNIVTEKDKKDIEFGIKNKVDFIAQSFVRHKQDILRVKKIVQSKLPKCRVFAKIENQQGVGNIDGIIDSCDGVMVARGDLGVSLPIYRIPIVQKDIIQRCNRKKKCVVTATQMLESMTDNPRPTRAEVSDVANAILDGTNYVMLSGETAAGSYPVKSVRMMCQIIEYTEQNRLKKG